MKVIIYIPDITRSLGGIYQYTYGLIKLLTSDKSNSYFVFNKNVDEGINEVKDLNNFLIIPIDEVRESNYIYKINRLKEEINYLFKRVGMPFRLPINFAINKSIKKYKIDILHCPYDDLPRSVSIPMITTIHDLQELHFPSYFTPEQRINRAITKDRISNEAKYVICSYEHIKKDIEKFFSIANGKVKVILLEMTNLWYARYCDDDIMPVETLGSHKEFLLYPAATWEHKNHKLLLRAFNRVRKEVPGLSLVCTGKKTNYYYEEIAPLIEKLGIGEEVIFTDTVEDNVLYSFYNQCKAVIIPTLYEAGSFPLMESILMNIPVICSNVTSLPETIANSEFLFDPRDTDEMGDKMIKICTDRDFRERNIENSSIQAPKLTDTGALYELVTVYNQL